LSPFFSISSTPAFDTCPLLYLPVFSVIRGSLLDTGSSRGFSSDPWSADVESDNTRNKGVNELVQQQHQIIAGKILI
jgi:hypothetical protein